MRWGVNIYFKKDFDKLFKENNAQGSVELILIIGGIIVIVLVCMFVYKSYMGDLGNELESGELNSLNTSFNEISSKFE
ncbi:MAG: class III signal peptide-containing protein [Methanobrevibacter sp.]|nr:class III signal peptide-containing protein [Methanobrevibacter sp.]